MVSIIARPTNRVRDRVPADSGWRAMASIAAATARPSARAGPIAPKETAMAAARMLIIWIVMVASALLDGADRAADEDGGEDREDVGLDEAGQDLQGHQRDRHQQSGQRQDDGDDELAAHDVAEQAHHQRE